MSRGGLQRGKVLEMSHDDISEPESPRETEELSAQERKQAVTEYPNMEAVGELQRWQEELLSNRPVIIEAEEFNIEAEGDVNIGSNPERTEEETGLLGKVIGKAKALLQDRMFVATNITWVVIILI